MVDAFAVIFGRSRVKLPAMAVTFGNFLGGVERFVVFIGEADGFADFLDNILIRGWRRAAGSLFAAFGTSPVGVNIASAICGRVRMVFAQLAAQYLAARSHA